MADSRTSELIRYDFNTTLREINEKKNKMQGGNPPVVNPDPPAVNPDSERGRTYDRLIEERVKLYDVRSSLWDESSRLDKDIDQLQTCLKKFSVEHYKAYGRFLEQDISPYSVYSGTVQSDEPIITIETSASAICNESRHLYDTFSFPNYPVASSFIPNERLRTLVARSRSSVPQEMLPNLRVIEAELRTLFTTSNSWGTSGSGSETNICDPNLLKLLQRIRIEINSHDVSVITRTKTLFEEKSFHLASTRSNPEPVLAWKDFIVLTSEAKGVNNSQFEAMVQGFQIGGDAALWLLPKLPREFCTVPVILSFSDSFQIFGVYLLPKSVPVLVPLSSPLSYICPEGRSTLAHWIILLSNFVRDTILELDRHSFQLCNAPKPLCLADLFFKPILGENNTHSIKLSSLLQAYDRLWQLEDVSNFFLFPIGLLAYPRGNEAVSGKRQMMACFEKYFPGKRSWIEDGCPVVAFELLPKATWDNRKPSPEYRTSYIQKLSIAVEKLNSVEVAHIDLRPENVMWKVESEELKEVSLQIIDFEESLPFQTPFKVPTCYKNDPRYPFDESSTVEVIGRGHNDWFFDAIRDWIESNSDSLSFTNFMSSWHLLHPIPHSS